MLNNIQIKKLESYDCVFHFFYMSLEEVGVDHFKCKPIEFHDVN